MTASTPVLNQHGLTEHSHGRTSAQVRSRGVDSHLHGIGSTDPEAHPLPSAKSEVWRFTPLRRMRGLDHDRVFDGIVGADNERSVQGPTVGPDAITVRRVTGDEAAALKGISGNLPTDRPSARAWQASESILLIDVPAETEFEEPLIVTFKGGNIDRAFAGHLIVRVGRNAKAQVAILHEGTQLLSDNMEIVVGDGAQLEFVALEEWDSQAVHLTHHHIRVGRDATVTHTALTFGGDLVRVVADVVYDGPGGAVELNGLYFADAGQHLEHRLFVDHAVPHCKSRALYKGALQGAKARTVWVGDVLIRRAAEGTDTYEMNRNLVLTEGARADSVPNLEIETGEIVGAGHASATGRFDDEQLFYLLSRGIPAEVARRLVVRGFFGEVLLRIGIESVRARTAEIIERELAIAGN